MTLIQNDENVRKELKRIPPEIRIKILRIFIPEKERKTNKKNNQQPATINDEYVHPHVVRLYFWFCLLDAVFFLL